MKKELDPRNPVVDKKTEAFLKRALKRKQLLEKSYEAPEDPGGDTALERLSKKRALINDPVDRIVVLEPRAYVVKFERRFYDQFRRLCGIKDNSKPPIFGHYTNLIVYKRFPPGALVRLKKLNPKDENGKRKHYHHQFLSEYAEIELISIIREVIIMMQQYNEMHVFLNAYCKEYKIPYQSSLLSPPL